MRSRQRSNLTMTKIKILMAFVSGWFVCSLVTPRFWHPLSSDTVPLSRATSTSNANLTLCETEVEAPPNLTHNIVSESEAPPLDKTPPVGGATTSTLPLPPRTSSRCEFLWDPASGCRRPPFKAFDTSRRANASCFGRFNGQPPPVVAIAALPRTGSALLKTALEFATGVRVGQAFEGQCSTKMYGFVETTYPFRRASVPPGCSFWLNRHVRTKPSVANVWGTVVIVRSPYRWLDDLFDSQETLPSARNESDWDPFLRRYSHMWRAFVEHWLLAEGGPLWESRSLPLDPRLMEEGPRELYSETINGQQQQPSGKLQRYFVVRYESLVKDPSKIAMEVLRWAKDVVVPDGLANTPSRLLARAERCVNYGNVLGRMARAHQEPMYGFGPRFKVTDEEPANSSQWARRRVVYEHTMPYLCALGNRPPKELPCA